MSASSSSLCGGSITPEGNVSSVGRVYSSSRSLGTFDGGDRDLVVDPHFEGNGDGERVCTHTGLDNAQREGPGGGAIRRDSDSPRVQMLPQTHPYYPHHPHASSLWQAAVTQEVRSDIHMCSTRVS